MRKFIDCNIIKVLYEVMRHHTEHYQSDFEIDKEIFLETALSSKKDKGLLWLCRPFGTHCLSENEVYIKDTYENYTWLFYGDQTSDPIIAYAVEIKNIKDGKIIGDLYELPYGQHSREVKNKALPADSIELSYKDGSKKTIPYTDNFGRYGNLDKIQYLPADPEQLGKMIGEIRRERKESKYYFTWDPDKFCYIGNSEINSRRKNNMPQNKENDRDVSINRELAGDMLDLVENLLDSKNITIPSADREGGESEARLYGREYWELLDEFESMLDEQYPEGAMDYDDDESDDSEM